MNDDRDLFHADGSLRDELPRISQVPIDPPTPIASVEAVPAKPARKRPTLAMELLTVVLLSTLLMLTLRVFVTQVYAISGHSMQPTLEDGQMVMIHKLSPNLFDLERGDVVIFTSPDDPKKDLIKRVVALAGDYVQIKDDQLFVNDELIEEDYARHSAYGRSVKRQLVPEGEIFVLGDNRPHSQDSRNFGSIQLDSVKGEVFFRLWPLDTMSTLP